MAVINVKLYSWKRFGYLVIKSVTNCQSTLFFTIISYSVYVIFSLTWVLFHKIRKISKAQLIYFFRYFGKNQQWIIFNFIFNLVLIPRFYHFSLLLKGILRPIFYIDINTYIDRKWKIMQSLLDKKFFFKMFKFLLTFPIDIITPVILSTQIACDVMCTTCNSLIFT